MNLQIHLYAAFALLSSATLGAIVHSLQLSPQAGASDLAFQMLDSNIARGQGIGSSGTLLAEIELGIFQQALRESIKSTNNTIRKDEWQNYLQSSVSSIQTSLSVVSTDTGLPLDRFSVGSSMVYQLLSRHNDSTLPAISALAQSLLLQPRNANAGLWYFDNRQNLSAYHNLSYLDGMFSYPSFALLASPFAPNISTKSSSFGLGAVAQQLRILFDICRTPDGLLVHGYDASKAHAWANPVTGASPVVWGRSLAWYTLGLLNALEIEQIPGFPTVSGVEGEDGMAELKGIFVDLVRGQVMAANRSEARTGSAGVWQVVDRPGESFAGHQNYIEASASCMTVYSLLRGASSGLIEDQALRLEAISAAEEIWTGVLERFLIRYGNGTLSLNGTSAIASLSGNVNYEYYVTRPVDLNSLIGTSAFILAALEVGKLCQ